MLPNQARRRTLPGFTLAWLMLAPLTANLNAYSVLSHEALIDAAWDPVIVPLLRERFPQVKPTDLRAAHAFAYGGCVIQDLGYYPLANHFFSDITHYARTGDFVRALVEESRTPKEYAFVLGALSHFVADDVGHPLGVNRAVPDIYPDLRLQYGNLVTYEDNPRAHVMTEFSFDVVQVAGAGYLPRTYHNFIGFQVAKDLLEQAFQKTYGLRLSEIFYWEKLSFAVYRVSASEIIPALGDSVWRKERKKLKRLDPQLVTPRFKYRLAPGNYQRPSSAGRSRLRWWNWHWKETAESANITLFSRLFVAIANVLPKVGPLAVLKFKPPTIPAQGMFIASFDQVVSAYQSDLSRVHAGSPGLGEVNLDTGKPSVAGQYKLADDVYARWLDKLAKHHFRGLGSSARQDILSFYRNLDAPISTKADPNRWKKLLSELDSLKAGQGESPRAADEPDAIRHQAGSNQ